MRDTVAKICYWLIIIAIPFLLGFGMIRAVLAWDYPAFEYGRIEPDRYGFTPEERYRLARATLDYMQRPEPAEEVIYLLEDLRLPGTDQPLYNEREIDHMLDVKRLTDWIGTLFTAAAAIIAFSIAYLFTQLPLRPRLYRALYWGGLATLIILTAIAAFILIGWSIFFVAFHELLFPPGTWTFSYSDSLIRLFPEQFWFDVGVIISVGTLILGGMVAAVGHLLWRRSTPKTTAVARPR